MSSSNNLIVNNSNGPGVLMMKGGVMGSNWFTSENGGNGIDFFVTSMLSFKISSVYVLMGVHNIIKSGC